MRATEQIRTVPARGQQGQKFRVLPQQSPLQLAATAQQDLQLTPLPDPLLQQTYPRQ